MTGLWDACDPIQESFPPCPAASQSPMRISARQSRGCRSACRPIFATGGMTRPSMSPAARARGSGTSTATSTSTTAWHMGPASWAMAIRAWTRRRGRASRWAACSRSRPSGSTRSPQRIAKMVPAAELVRFSNSGSEAVMAALARRQGLHRQGLLRGGGGRLSRRLRRGALVHAHRRLGPPCRRAPPGALQRRRARHAPVAAPCGSHERRQPPGERLQGLRG